jgi:hypothetical protein
MVTYATFRAQRTVYDLVNHQLFVQQATQPRDEIARVAVGLLDEAAKTIEKTLPSSLHPFVGAEDVAYVATALAVTRLEGAPVLGIALHVVASAAMDAYAWAIRPNEN